MARAARGLVAKTSDPEVFVDGAGRLVLVPGGCICEARMYWRPAHSAACERIARLPIASSPAFNRELYPRQDCIPLCPTTC